MIFMGVTPRRRVAARLPLPDKSVALSGEGHDRFLQPTLTSISRSGRGIPLGRVPPSGPNPPARELPPNGSHRRPTPGNAAPTPTSTPRATSGGNHLPPGESGRPAFDERLNPLGGVRGAEQPGHLGPQLRNGCRISLVARPVGRRQRRADTERCRTVRDRVGDLAGARERGPRGGRDLLDQPDLVCLAGVELVAGEDPAHRVAPPPF